MFVILLSTVDTWPPSWPTDRWFKAGRQTSLSVAVALKKQGQRWEHWLLSCLTHQWWQFQSLSPKLSTRTEHTPEPRSRCCSPATKNTLNWTSLCQHLQVKWKSKSENDVTAVHRFQFFIELDTNHWVIYGPTVGIWCFDTKPPFAWFNDDFTRETLPINVHMFVSVTAAVFFIVCVAETEDVCVCDSKPSPNRYLYSLQFF